MTEIEGEGERRRGLEGTVSRIARKLKVGGGGFLRPLIIGVDPDPCDGEPHIWLPPIDDEPQGIAEEPGAGTRQI